MCLGQRDENLVQFKLQQFFLIPYQRKWTSKRRPDTDRQRNERATKIPGLSFLLPSSRALKRDSNANTRSAGCERIQSGTQIEDRLERQAAGMGAARAAVSEQRFRLHTPHSGERRI